MADTFVWTPTLAGTFAYDTAGNWADTTTPAETGVVAPGTADTATLIGPGSGTAQTVTGPGSAATLDISGLNALTGSFSTGITNIFAPQAGGAAYVDLSGTLATAGELRVGYTTNGSLTIESGATVIANTPTSSTAAVAIGSSAGSNGTIIIAAGGSLLLDAAPDTANYLLVIGNAGQGTLAVAGAGATLDTGGNALALGNSAGSNGVLTVTDGAHVTTSTGNSAVIAAAAIGRVGAGTLLVSDPGSTFTANGLLYVGRAQSGVLAIENSGVVFAGAGSDVTIGVGNGTLASLTGGVALAEITSGGSLMDSGSLVVGGNGVNGFLDVTGGLVDAANQLLIGVGSTIAGSYYTGSGTIEIGAGGTIDITGTAHPGSTGVSVGSAAGATGVIQIGGSNSTLNVGANLLTIGSSGTGDIALTQGGTLLAASPGTGFGAIVLGNSASGVGTLTVDGQSGATAVGALTVGFSGTGTVAITNGGSIFAESAALGSNGGSSGSVGLSGAGSTLAIANTLLVGGVNATNVAGTLQIGAGAAVSANAGSIGSNGILSLDGGTFSAASSLSLLSGGFLGGFGTVAGAITDRGGAIDATGALALTGPVAGTADISVGSAADLTYGIAVGTGIETDFSGTGGRIDLLAPGDFGGSIGNFRPGDIVFAAGADSISYDGGTSIKLFDAGNPLGTIALTQTYAPGVFADTGGTITEAPCFRAGTLIDTVDGPVAVEAMRPGMQVITWRTGTPGVTSIRWTGHRRVDVARHPHPERINPVRVQAHAFAPMMPHRALFLSPDHAVFVDGVLIPIKHLINGRSIAQVSVDTVEYWHVELDRHDVLRAEGLAVESYLDTGNRAAFANGCAHIALHPDFQPLSWDQACAELVTDGPRVTAAKKRLFQRAGIGSMPVLALEVRARGRRLTPDILADGGWCYDLPRRTRTIDMLSPAWVPASSCADSLDQRRLGVRLFGVAVDGRPAAFADKVFRSGFHPTEVTAEGLCRWTDGRAQLHLPARARQLVLWVADTVVSASGPEVCQAA